MKIRTSDVLPLILLLVFAVVPLLLGITYALLYSFGIVGVLNHGVTTENWKAAFASNEIPFSFLYTVALSFVSLALCVGAAIFLSLYLQKNFKKGIASYIIYLPMAFPTVVAAFFFLQFLGNAGFLSRLFYKIGIIKGIADFPDLVNDRFSNGIITAQFFLTLPILILLYLSIIKNENIERLKTLASSLGANKKQILWRITLPALIKKSLPTIILFFIFKLGSYEIPLLLGRSSPETISVLTVRKMQRFNLSDIPQGYVVAVLYAAMVLILLVVSLKPSKLSINV